MTEDIPTYNQLTAENIDLKAAVSNLGGRLRIAEERLTAAELVLEMAVLTRLAISPRLLHGNDVRRGWLIEEIKLVFAPYDQAMQKYLEEKYKLQR